MSPVATPTTPNAPPPSRIPILVRGKRKASVASPCLVAKRRRYARRISRAIERATVHEYPEASLGGIPEEILLHIAQLVPDYRSLANLSLVDRRCGRVATEVLYAGLHNTFWDFDQAKVIRRFPLLAQHLRSFRLVLNNVVDNDATVETFLNVLGKAHNVQSVEIDESDHHFFRYSALRLEKAFRWIWWFSSAVAPRASRAPLQRPRNRFTHLKTLTITAQPLQVEKISCVFLLPALQVLRLDSLHQKTPFEIWTIPRSTCPIQSLSLTNAAMDIDAVTKMIASIKTLRDFTYHRTVRMDKNYVGERDNAIVGTLHSWSELGDALRQHRNHLRYLEVTDITDRTYMNHIYPHSRNFGYLGSFTDFSDLSYCAAPIEAFLNMQPEDPIAADEDMAGKFDLSLYLPAHLEYFATEIEQDDQKTLRYLSLALASLERVVCAGPQPTISMELTRDQQCNAPWLSETLSTLEHAGIRLVLFDGNTYLTTDKIRRVASQNEDYDKEFETDEEWNEDEEYEENYSDDSDNFPDDWTAENDEGQPWEDEEDERLSKWSEDDEEDSEYDGDKEWNESDEESEVLSDNSDKWSDDWSAEDDTDSDIGEYWTDNYANWLDWSANYSPGDEQYCVEYMKYKRWTEWEDECDEEGENSEAPTGSSDDWSDDWSAEESNGGFNISHTSRGRAATM